MSTHPHHVHPRHKRTAAAAPYRPLFKPLKLVKVSGARPAETYRAAKRNAHRSDAKWRKAKAERIAMGMTRSQRDRWIFDQKQNASVS